MRRRCDGQASVEAIALVPVIVCAVVVVWQLVVLTVAALQAHEQVRARAVTGSGRVVADASAPALLPVLGRLRLRATAEVYGP